MNNEKYTEVIQTETELVEILLGLMKQQQNAIIHFRDSELTTLVGQQQDVLRPLEELEKERINMTGKAPGMDDDDARAVRRKLRGLVSQILEVNAQNKVLLENSLKFIQRNLRIITEDYTRQLIDAKI